MSDTPPKIFVSYSRTDEEHLCWVADLGERLMSDGIDVVLDQWSLEDGHDVNAFMEKMVSDPSIMRVIIISDSLYAAKADGRKGGVGTETQIISKEVYDSVDQRKFVPILRERDPDGEACLPVFLKSRKYIDFSRPELEADSYDQLVRNIFERPKRTKPAMGKPPTHIFDDSTIPVSSVQKARRFREAIMSGKGSASLAFADFAEEFISNLEELRIAYSNELKDTWCEVIYQNIALSLLHRDVFVSVVQAGAKSGSKDEFFDQLIQLLETILPLMERPDSTMSAFEISQDNYKFFIYELFLYSVAVLIKAKNYWGVKALIEHRYIAPSTYGGSNLERHDFTAFNPYAESLERFCSQQSDSRRISVMADLLHSRCNRKDIRYSDLLQADAVLCLAAIGHGWYPRSMIYSRGIGTLELFLRAETAEGFLPLGTMLSLKSPRELVERMESDSVSRVLRSSDFFRASVSLGVLNYGELTRIWSDRT